MSPVGVIFVPFPPRTGTNVLHPLSPPIIELVFYPSAMVRWVCNSRDFVLCARELLLQNVFGKI